MREKDRRRVKEGGERERGRECSISHGRDGSDEADEEGRIKVDARSLSSVSQTQRDTPVASFPLRLKQAIEIYILYFIRIQLYR